MQQTPVHDIHNDDLLQMFPRYANKLMEIGCSSGALAREYKKINPKSHYTGLEIDAEYGELAKRYCDQVVIANIDNADESFYQEYHDRDAWIFADTLEHLKDPWSVLRHIRQVIPEHGCILACIPNAQHWSVQLRLATGNFFYEDMGLMDRTHLRWFTRVTMFDLFQSTGFHVVNATSRIFASPQEEQVLKGISAMADTLGLDRDMMINDAKVFQFLFKAVPI